MKKDSITTTLSVSICMKDKQKRGGEIHGYTDRSKNIVFFEDPLMSQVVQQEALTRLLVEKEILTKEEFLNTIKRVNEEMREKRKGVK